MDVVVVRIIYLDRQEKALDLETSPNAEETLANFCKWQETINPADVSNPQHHDIAVLLTRWNELIYFVRLIILNENLLFLDMTFVRII